MENARKRVEKLQYFDPSDPSRYAQYVDDPDYNVIEDDEGGPTIVAKKYTDEEWDKLFDYMDNHPLFKNDLDWGDVDSNEYLQALQSIKYDEDAEITMERLYHEGNKIMKEKLLGKKKRPIFFIKKAMDIYIDALSQEAQCLELRKKILCNRALINLWLKNFGKVVEDCMKAITIDKDYVRPYARAAEAFNSLEQFSRGIKICQRGLEVDSKNKILKELLKEAKTGFNKQQEIKNKKKAQEKLKKSEVYQACIKKSIVLGKLSDFPLPEAYPVSLILKFLREK